MDRITPATIRWFETLGIEDLDEVGGKNANLGEMVRNLKTRGIRVPNGFAITSDAYWRFVDHNHLRARVHELLHDLDHDDLSELKRRAGLVREAYLNAEFPEELKTAILEAYRTLNSTRGHRRDVAVRSSATAEDLPNASFAGQQETFLNIQDEAHLIESIQKCFASLFTDRAIAYRKHANFDHFKVALSVGIQEMVRSDLGVSGVMFTIDTESGFRDAVITNASYGLGENVVQGNVNPDEYIVFKPTLQEGKSPILKKKLGTKESRMIYAEDGKKGVENIDVSHEERTRFALTDAEILSLAKAACTIEAHYSEKSKHPTPMDIEWAKDGITGEIYIVQARPETVQSQKVRATSLQYSLLEKGPVLITGRSVGEKIATGRVRVIESAAQISELKRGEILVTDRTDPDWEPAMKLASAIVTNRGGRTCHAAIIARELGIPAVVGTESGTKLLQNGMEVTVSSAEGECGYVYQGKLAFETKEHIQVTTDGLETKVMLNLGNPEEAFKISFVPNEGVGLARLEFIIGNGIKIHPMALLRYPNLKDESAIKQIDELTIGYSNKSDYFVTKLAEETGTLAAAFYPKDVIVRMSDFKSNEYANLIGGREFEPTEENPMIGFRGASRYSHPRYQEGFALECKAMKKVRDEMGLFNLKLMIPFCRTLEEARLVVNELAKNGMVRGENGLQLYMMCEIPSNVILIEEFGEYFDGFSIGSNDLTQLTLGIDRDSELIATSFDERNPAVKKMISHAIKHARKNGKKIGICGQAPSDYPEFADFLVKEGIHSMSLNPDSVTKTIPVVRSAEFEVKQSRTIYQVTKTKAAELFLK